MLCELTRQEGDNYELNPAVTGSPIGISLGYNTGWSETVKTDGGYSGPLFRRTVVVFGKNAGGALDTSNEIGRITVTYRVTEVAGIPEDWQAKPAPDAANVKSDGTSATTNQVTIKGTTNWDAGKYRLYLVGADGKENSLAVYDLSTADDTLTFTVNSGLNAGNNQVFKLAYYGEINGYRDSSELSEGIELNVTAAVGG